MANTCRFGVTLLAGVVVLSGCEGASSKRSAPPKPAAVVEAGAPDRAASAEPSRAAAQPALAPKDLDVAALRKKLKCPRGNRLPCRVVDEFAKAGRWVWQKPGGTGRWVGRTYTIADGKLTKDFMALWAKEVPTAQVEQDMLPLKIGSQTLPADLRSHREKLIVSLEGDDAVSRHNRALPWVKEWEPPVKVGAFQTDGASTVVLAESRTYRRTIGRKTLLIIPSADLTDKEGNGTYAELWAASW
jgi:hypothetical protein